MVTEHPEPNGKVVYVCEVCSQGFGYKPDAEYHEKNDHLQVKITEKLIIPVKKSFLRRLFHI
jgi:hypothetical protein